VASAAQPTAVRLNFPDYAKKLRRAADLTDTPPDDVVNWFTEMTPPWVASYADGNDVVVVHLEGAVGHPNWDEEVLSAINKHFENLRKRTGVTITLIAD